VLAEEQAGAPLVFLQQVQGVSLDQQSLSTQRQDLKMKPSQRSPVDDRSPSVRLLAGGLFVPLEALPCTPQEGAPQPLKDPVHHRDTPLGCGSFPALTSNRVGPPLGSAACDIWIWMATWQNRQFIVVVAVAGWCRRCGRPVVMLAAALVGVDGAVKSLSEILIR